MVGTWTYNPSTNVITVTGGDVGAPAGFIDAWNADKAGTLNLASRTGISAIDGSPVNLTYNLRPTDYYVLGGAAQDLYIVISAWTNMVSATIRLIGTDSAGNAQTEDIVVTGNGTYYATKYFHTLTQSQVIAFTKSDSGSFAYTVTQGQWGVVWKYTNNQYQLDVQRLDTGDGSTSTYFGDTKKQVTFPVASGGGIIQVKGAATLRLGTLLNATRKTTADGCSLLSTIGVSGQTGIALIYDDSATGLMYLYGCYFSSIRPSYVQPRHASQVYNCKGDNCLFFVRDTADYYNLEVYNATLYYNPCAYIIQTATATTVNLRAYDCTNGVYEEGPNAGVISNPYFRGLTYIARFYQYSGSLYLINVDTDTWSIVWVGAQSGILYRQYTFDLTVTGSAGTPISGATVTLKDKNGNTVFSLTTDVNGKIATQTVTRGYYDQPHGSTLQDYSPHTLTITKAGWQKYVKTFTLTEKTKWEIKLAKAQQILLDLGKPVLNLKPSDPENKVIMSL
jgi:hypothetical protein